MNAGSGNLALKKKTIGIATNQKYTSARLLEVTNTTQNTGWLTTAWLAVFKNKMTVIISNKKKEAGQRTIFTHYDLFSTILR